MPLIIDGHNLIPKVPGMSLSIVNDEEILIKMLVEYSRVIRKDISLYFDNAPPGAAKMQRFGLITVNFVRQGRTADAEIRSQLKRLGKRAKNWAVVSSDREVQMSARIAGAGVISSDDFAKSLLSVLDEDREMLNEEQENYPDEVEIQQWLEIFRQRSAGDED